MSELLARRAKQANPEDSSMQPDAASRPKPSGSKPSRPKPSRPKPSRPKPDGRFETGPSIVHATGIIQLKSPRLSQKGISSEIAGHLARRELAIHPERTRLDPHVSCL